MPLPNTLSGDELRVLMLDNGRPPLGPFYTDVFDGEVRAVADEAARLALLARGVATHDGQLAPGARAWLAPLLDGAPVAELSIPGRRHVVAERAGATLLLTERHPHIWAAVGFPVPALALVGRLLDRPGEGFPKAGSFRVAVIDRSTRLPAAVEWGDHGALREADVLRAIARLLSS